MIKSLLLALAMCSVYCAGAQFNQKNIDKAVAKAEKQGFSGVILLADSSGVRYETALGKANLEDKTTVAMDTRFRIGNITELFTLLPIMQLVEYGSIDFSLTMQQLMPELRLENGSKITLKHVITHTSGFADADSMLMERLTPTEIIRECMNDKANIQPVGTYQYSKANYLILGVLIQKYRLKDWKYVLEDDIIRAQEMTGSGEHEKGQVIKGLATGYLLEDGQSTPEPAYQIGNLHSTGSFYSTAGDLLKLARLYHSGELFDPTLLKTFEATKGEANLKEKDAFAADYRQRQFRLQGFSGSISHTDDGKVLIILSNTSWDHSGLFNDLAKSMKSL